MDDKYLPAYNILTNALQAIERTEYTDPADNILMAINNYIYEMPDLTLQQILSFYAGFAIANLEYPVEARAFVADFPLKYRKEIEEIITGVETYPTQSPAITEKVPHPDVIEEKASNFGDDTLDVASTSPISDKRLFIVITVLCVLLMSCCLRHILFNKKAKVKK